MQYSRLGNSGLITSNLALGTMIFGEQSERSTSPKESERIIHCYLDAGGNHIDTANVYGGGVSEEIVGKAIKHKRNQVILATKVRFSQLEGPNQQGLSRSHIIGEVENSLKRMQTDMIDLYYMHGWDNLTPIEESLKAFEDLISSGKVRYIGVSNFKAWQVMKSLGICNQNGWSRFIVGQYQYSLVVRDIDYEFVDFFEAEGIGLVPWGPLGGGFLSGKYQKGHRPLDASEGRIASTPSQYEESWEYRNQEKNWNTLYAVGEIAEAHSATHSQVALAWLIAQPVVSSAIMGVRTMEQLVDNLKASDLQLPEEDINRLSEVSQLPSLYPYRFIESFARNIAFA